MIRSSLTRDRILQAALALADAEGLSAVTMRRLGESLGVEAMSLYNHVANKEQILDGLIDGVFAEVSLPPPEVPWDQALRLRTRSAREVLARHPWATPLMDSRSTPGPATLEHHDAVLGCLRRAGFSVAGAAHAVSLLDAYLYGFALQQRALPFENGTDVTKVAARLMASFPVERYPHLAEMITDHALKPGYDYGQEFDFGLDLILEGLDRTLGQRASGARV